MSNNNDKEWQRLFHSLLAKTCHDYRLRSADIADRLQCSAETVSSWRQGRNLPAREIVPLLRDYISSNVRLSERDYAMRDLVRSSFEGFGAAQVFDALDWCYRDIGRFLGFAIEYCYHRSKGDRWELPADSMPFEPTGRIRAVAFDFAGTLTREMPEDSTWYWIWDKCELDKKEFMALHRGIENGSITRREYLEGLVAKFRAAQLTRAKVNKLGSQCEFRGRVPETFRELDKRNIRIYVVSRSEREFIRGRLGDLAMLTEEIHCNYFTYGSDGIVDSIVGTDFDREGKARFVKRMARELRISTSDVLFVGNSRNDRFVRATGARTVCIDSHNMPGNDKRYWSERLTFCDDTYEIIELIDQGKW